ncbi:hypothetical protein QOT17_003065 [Balamuthia mandrillaris]
MRQASQKYKDLVRSLYNAREAPKTPLLSMRVSRLASQLDPEGLWAPEFLDSRSRTRRVVGLRDRFLQEEDEALAQQLEKQVSREAALLYSDNPREFEEICREQEKVREEEEEQVAAYKEAFARYDPFVEEKIRSIQKVKHSDLGDVSSSHLYQQLKELDAGAARLYQEAKAARNPTLDDLRRWIPDAAGVLAKNKDWEAFWRAMKKTQSALGYANLQRFYDPQNYLRQQQKREQINNIFAKYGKGSPLQVLTQLKREISQQLDREEEQQQARAKRNEFIDMVNAELEENVVSTPQEERQYEQWVLLHRKVKAAIAELELEGGERDRTYYSLFRDEREGQAPEVMPSPAEVLPNYPELPDRLATYNKLIKDMDHLLEDSRPWYAEKNFYQGAPLERVPFPKIRSDIVSSMFSQQEELQLRYPNWQKVEASLGESLNVTFVKDILDEALRSARPLEELTSLDALAETIVEVKKRAKQGAARPQDQQDYDRAVQLLKQSKEQAEAYNKALWSGKLPNSERSKRIAQELSQKPNEKYENAAAVALQVVDEQKALAEQAIKEFEGVLDMFRSQWHRFYTDTFDDLWAQHPEWREEFLNEMRQNRWDPDDWEHNYNHELAQKDLPEFFKKRYPPLPRQQTPFIKDRPVETDHHHHH